MLKNVHILKINPIASRNQSAPDGVEYTTDYILFLGSHTMHLAFKINPNLDRLQGCSLIQPDQLNAAVNCVLEHGSQSIVECP
jgi:hypothetical protein